MINLFINGLAASAGGGLTYLRNVIPHLAARTDVRTTVAVSFQLRQELAGLCNISFLEVDHPPGAVRRFWHEQTVLPRIVRQSGADVVISAGNFALRRSPVAQILLSRNSLYTSADFFRDLRARREYRLRWDTRIRGMLAKRSIHWADCTVAPSAAFAETLSRWAGVKVTPIHHGFDRDVFFSNQAPLPADMRQTLDAGGSSLKLLFVSHYNYYRNFETLLRAIPHLRKRLVSRMVKLFLTCRLRSEENPGAYRAEAAAALVHQLGIAENVVELGSVPHHLLHHVYRACDIYVTPAYAESFAHPLVEAMASRLPVVASNLPVHREICGDAALYFETFSAEDLGERILRVAQSESLAQGLADRGGERSQDFSWQRHVDEMISLARSLSRAA
jgi:glycosyltransferase involved in cell wall biosynthesis